MKKVVFASCLFVAFHFSYSQPILVTEAPVFDNSTSTGRGPNGTSAHAYMRAVELVKAIELTGIAPGTTLTSFGFTVNAGAATTAPTGNFTVYLQNTTDATYLKGTVWATAITGMTSVYASTMTLPISVGATSVMLTLSTPFVYNGGGIYVAYDWYCAGPYSTANVVYRCNSGGLSPGCATAASGVAPAPTTLGTTAFRPCILWGVTNTYTNEVSIIGIEALGRVAGMFNTGHNIKGIVRNNSNATMTNIPVSLNVTGANVFANTQTISSLASGASTTITFPAFNPVIAGLNTLLVSVPSDQNNANNSSTFSQSVTCNEWALNPAGVSYTQGAVGYGAGSGIIAVTYSNPVTSTLTGMRLSISTNAATTGNLIWGALLSSAGVILATTNTITITSLMLGTFQTFTFATPPVLTSSTVYYMGLAQSTGTVAYFPVGTYTVGYVPFTNFVTTAITGGAVAPLTSNLGYGAMEAIFSPVAPTVNVSSATVTCGTQATLSATTSASYTWTSGPANANYLVTPTISSTYSLNALSISGCSASKTTAVIVNPIPISASSGTICSGLVFIITPGGATTYTYTDGTNILTGISATVSPAATTNYTIAGSNTNGCAGSSTIALTVNANPTITANNATICPGNTAVITPTGGLTYTITGNSFTVSPAVTTIYSITGTGTNNCISPSIAAAIVFVNSTPTVSVNSGSICSGNSFTIIPSGASSYTISGNNFTVSPITTSSYSITGTGTNNCVSANTAVCTVTVNLTPTLGVNSPSVCSGNSVLIVPTGANAYTITGNTFSVSPNSTTSYSITGTSIAGCAASNTVIANVSVSISPTISVGSGAICQGNSAVIIPSGADTYTITGNTFTVTPITTTSYSITGTSTAGCLSSNTAVSTISVNPLPTVMLASSSPTVCLGESAVLTASGTALSYSWSSAQTGTSINIFPTANTAYTVTGVNAYGCVNSATLTQYTDLCTGLSVSRNESNMINLYPNPNKGEFTVEAAEGSEVMVITALGEMIYFERTSESKATILITDFASGVYFVRVKASDRQQTMKVIKE